MTGNLSDCDFLGRGVLYTDELYCVFVFAFHGHEMALVHW